jgi:hypothetical protein
MKKAIAVFACLTGLACVQALGQATVVFANLAAGVNAPIFLMDLEGNDIGRVPVGNEYMIQLWAGPAGATTPGVDLLPVEGATAPFGPVAGYFNGGNKDVTATVLGIDPQADLATVSVAISAYDTKTGGAQTHLTGVSNILDAQLTGGGTVPAKVLLGLQSFGIPAVPEPSTMALGLLGAAALFLRRRK